MSDARPSLAARVNGVIFTITSVALAAIVALTFADVLLRHLLNRPIFGANDMTEHLMALIVFLGLPLVSRQGGHVRVDLFDRQLSRPSLWPWRAVLGGISAVMLGIMAYAMARAAIDAVAIQEVSQALRLPRAGLYAFFALSAAISAVMVLIYTGRHLNRPRTEGGEAC